MLRSLCLLAAVASVAVAAPVPKAKEKDGAVDLSALHALIAKRAEKGEWSEKDAEAVTKTLPALVEKLTDAGGAGWKLPVQLDTAGVVFLKGPVKIVKAGVYLVDGDVTGVEKAGCVILATGTVASMYLEDCVVVAHRIEPAAATNCLLVAADRVEASSVIGKPESPDRACLVVAGKQIESVNVCDGVCHVIAPDPKGGPAVLTTYTRDTPTVLVPPGGHEVKGKGFKRVELKAPIAK